MRTWKKGTVLPPSSTLDNVINLCKRRGFVFPCGEIYGGSRAAWDYGPYGVELKENIKRQWWRSMVTSRDDIVGLDSSIILPRQVWVASGHVGVFTDPLVESLVTHKRYRADHLWEASRPSTAASPRAGTRCPTPRPASAATGPSPATST
jgi:glycyl-tRNA synthetase